MKGTCLGRCRRTVRIQNRRRVPVGLPSLWKSADGRDSITNEPFLPRGMLGKEFVAGDELENLYV
jgi:hypothetical protein